MYHVKHILLVPCVTGRVKINILRAKTNNISTGQLGEAVAARFLADAGWEVLERNCHLGFAEIDIIVQIENMVHFVEVKTVSYETINKLEQALNGAYWRPEEQVHQRKLHKIGQAAETWVQQQSFTGNWQIDVIGVRIVPRETYATVNLIENV